MFGLKKKITGYFERKAVVLMYHRVAYAETDPWQLAVTPENFEEHLQVLKQFNVIPVNKLAADLSAKSISRKSICITFDDGYKDNYLSAKPLLEKYDKAATIFITSGTIDTEKEFWWDELDTLLLSGNKLPENLSVNIRGKHLNFTLPSAHLLKEQISEQKNWKYELEPPTSYCKAYLKIWEELRPLPQVEIEKVLGSLREWANGSYVKSDKVAMTKDELQTFTSHPLFTLGAHTVTHPALAYHPPEKQRDEIENSSSFLLSRGVNSVDTVSYPYGIYNAETVDIVKEQRFKAAFTTHEQTVTAASKPLELGRFQVNNWDGDQFEEQLYSWFKNN